MGRRLDITGLLMSSWISCNACFLPPSDDRKLAVTTCGHVICDGCYSKGKQGICLICNSRCQVSSLSDQSSSEVKALFSDVSVVAAKHCKEISKVLMFQASHQKRLCSYYQQKSEKQKDAFVQMKQEMQQMSKKLNEQSASLTKLENALHHHRANSSSMAQVAHSSHIPRGHNSGLQIPKSSPLPISRHSSMSNVTESMEVSKRSLFMKPSPLPRVPLFGASQTGQMGSVRLRLSSRDSLANHTAGISTFPGSAEASYSQTSRWESPVFKPPPSFRTPLPSLF
ncbi:probable E3 SUMO-protein ligase RNF212 isoform X1 [Takifugu rubripes]|uniref:Ring finger protein 212 n=2 Tax=Takifugu rubripes TaxID=31033 RepID=A0A674N6L6_TAKRU|nr:probable E3 SUMO-protein ligase RNF212 isoform X1 [Takifugu rubripes]